MRFYCISDNLDTALGMRLSGIDGVVVHAREEVEQALEKAFADEQIGILLITEKLNHLCPERIASYKLAHKRPLIVEIPDRHGNSDISGSNCRGDPESPRSATWLDSRHL